MSVAGKKIIWLIAVTLIFAVAVYGMYRATHKNTISEMPMVAEEIAVIKPHNQDAVITHGYIGQVEAINETNIVPFISGYVTAVAVQGGQKVKKGDVLAVLKQDEYLAQLAIADASIFALKADFLNAKIKYERMKNSGEDVYSEQEIDDAKSAFLSAAGDLEKARAEQFAAQTDFDYTYIKAPFDGVLGNIAVSIGDYISPQSQNLMELVQDDPIRVVFSVTDKEFLNRFDKKNEPPLSVKIRLANGDILPQSGEIKYTANVIDKSTNSLAVYAEFTNPDNLLMPNAYVQVLLEREYKNVVLIPKQKIVMKNDGDYVYTVMNGVLNLHKLHVFGESNNMYVAKNNFAAEEYIVTDTSENLSPGEKVPYKIVSMAE